MKTTTKVKWIVGLVGGIALVALVFFGRKTVHTELVIPASPSEIWTVLTDAPRYREWNPVFVDVKGEYREGATLTYQMREPSGKQSEVVSSVVRAIDAKELNQFGGIRGILTFDHKWLLEPVDGGTRVTQHEEYRGIGIWFWDESWVEPAYARANEALRDRVVEH